ncbi:MAG: pitrilysin family protein [Candidatus Moranbacteria bacterium]|nr:pitrilysin family protein [Candidatus Moranbacteria bacterium]
MIYKKTTLKNGLRVITAPMRDTATATVLVMVGVGSRYEEDAEAGISHFIEHMLFKGTKKRPNAKIISEEMDSIGGEFNAFTGKNKTAYYAKADAKHLDNILDVISDICLNSKFESKEIKKEAGTILQEISMYEDMPMQSIEDEFEGLLYGRQKLGRPIAGYPKTVSGVKRKNFVDYMSKHYLPESTVVCVAGKIDEKKVMDNIRKHFSKMKKKDKPVFEKVRENQKVPKIKIKYKKTDQTHLVLGARTYHNKHKDKYVLALLATILGGNMSSRLFLSVRERQGLAYYVRTGNEFYQDAGYLATQCGVKHGNLSKTIGTILKEYKKISRQKVDEKELRKAKDYIKGKTVMSLESSDAVAGFLADQEVIKDEILMPEEIFKRIDKVTADDIKRVAKDIFVPEKLNLAIIGPHNNKEKLEKLLIL